MGQVQHMTVLYSAQSRYEASKIPFMMVLLSYRFNIILPPIRRHTCQIPISLTLYLPQVHLSVVLRTFSPTSNMVDPTRRTAYDICLRAWNRKGRQTGDFLSRPYSRLASLHNIAFWPRPKVQESEEPRRPS